MAEAIVRARLPNGDAKGVASESEGELLRPPSGPANAPGRDSIPRGRLHAGVPAGLTSHLIGEPAPLPSQLTNLVIPVVMLCSWSTCRRSRVPQPAPRARSIRKDSYSASATI